MPEALRAHFASRGGEHAGVLGVFLCQASRLPELITELIKIKPKEPLPLSLIIDTGLGGVPKAISIVESRSELLSLRMVEMPAPSDVDEVWLERVSEFVPEDVIRVVEPRRGVGWLDGVRNVIEHGSWPKIRCGGKAGRTSPAWTRSRTSCPWSAVRRGRRSRRRTACTARSGTSTRRPVSRTTAS